MSEYDRTNTFILFQNDKGDNDRAPDRTGTLNVNGVEYYMDGWLKQGKNGPFLSGKIKPKKQPMRRDARHTTTSDETPPF